jgi:hypothetical protein
MLSLADTERRVRDALVDGDASGLVGLLVGGHDPSKRLAIHQRHYEISLTAAVVTKFPATSWLAGASFLTEAARDFVHALPPTAPCIAEYAAEFPTFVATRPGVERMPYLQDFAALEWAIGVVSIAIDEPTIGTHVLASADPALLPDFVLTVQPGVRYVEAAWPVDDLMRVYLSSRPPDTYEFEPAHTCLEIRGARGAFDIRRLDVGDFVFRREVMRGHSIGEAAQRTLDDVETWDPGACLSGIIAEGLVTAAVPPREHRP